MEPMLILCTVLKKTDLNKNWYTPLTGHTESFELKSIYFGGSINGDATLIFKKDPTLYTTIEISLGDFSLKNKISGD